MPGVPLHIPSRPAAFAVRRMPRAYNSYMRTPGRNLPYVGVGGVADEECTVEFEILITAIGGLGVPSASALGEFKGE